MDLGLIQATCLISGEFFVIMDCCGASRANTGDMPDLWGMIVRIIVKNLGLTQAACLTFGECLLS